MRGRWVAVLALTAMLAGCGIAAPRPVAQAAGTAAVTRAPVGSRAAALALARQMLSRLVVPAGSQAARPSPVPSPLSVSSAGGVSSYAVDLHRFVLVREPAATVRSFLLAHVPAGMGWAGDGLAPGTTNTVTVLWVAYRPRSLAPGLASAELGTAAMPSADGGTLIRADATVSWFPPRSAAEQLNAASFRSVTVTAAEAVPQPRTVTRTFTSPAVIGRLTALVNSLPATPYPDVAGMSCLPVATVYRLDFTPGVVIYPGGCGGSDAITVNGKQQPRLWDQGVLTAAATQLLTGTSNAPLAGCGGGEQPVGYLGVVRPGKATAARAALGTALLAEVSDTGLGVVDIAVTANGMSAARRQRDFSSWGPVLPQARQARLQSCDMLLSDRPADQTLISAALAAVAKQGYGTPAARLKSKLLEVLVSDNPAASGSVIVTLQASGGPAYEQLARGAPPVHGYLVYTVLENVSGAQVTGVAPGGFGAEAPSMVKCRIGPAPPASVYGPEAAAIDAINECR
ncbi:MAG: hypothetical protein ACRDPY_42285 [Streptosporangiaceae bacterium]